MQLNRRDQSGALWYNTFVSMGSAGLKISRWIMFFSSTWWQHSPVSKQTGITSQQAAVYSHLLYSRYGAALLCLSVFLCFMQIPKEISVLRKTVFNDSVQWTVSQEGWMVICIQFKLCHDLFFFFKKVFVFLVVILSHKNMKCSMTPCSLQDWKPLSLIQSEF